MKHLYWLLACVTASCLAQVPDAVIVGKLRGFRQTSASDVQAAPSSFFVVVTFPSPPPLATRVQLQHPNGTTLALSRDVDGSYVMEQEFADLPALNTAYPDGAYTFSISGGTVSASVPVAITSSVSPGTTKVSNFDALQNWPDPYPRVTWSPIPGVSSDTLAQLVVTRKDGADLFDSGFDAVATQGGISMTTQMPYNEEVDGTLMLYGLAVSSANNGSTAIGVLAGYYIQFPIKSVPLPLAFTKVPSSMVVHVGDTVPLSAELTGINLTVSLKKNGAPLVTGLSVGTTNNLNYASHQLVVRQATDAGTYTFEAKSGSSTVTSTAFDVVVAPTLVLTSFAGTGNAGSADGGATSAQFRVPAGLAFDGAGNLYVADRDNATIRKITPAGVVSTVAGSPGLPGSADGTTATARFDGPRDVAADASGTLYVADTNNHTIRKIATDGTVTTLAGAARQTGSADGNTTAARFNQPTALTLDLAGNLLVSDTGNGTIRKVTPAGVVSTLAGSAGHLEMVDGVGASARFVTPLGSTLDRNGNLYVCDQLSLRIVTPTGQVSTLGAAGTTPALLDTGRGDGRAGSRNQWADVAMDGSGALYVSSFGEIRRITPGGVTAVVATTVAQPQGLAVDASGQLYLTSGLALNEIDRGTLSAGSNDPKISIIAQSAANDVAAGTTAVLRADAIGPGRTYQWLRNGTMVAGATSATLVLRNTSAAQAGDYTVLIGNGAGFVSSATSALRIANTTDTGRLTNVSIRTVAGSGAQTLLVGLALANGSSSATKPLLIRGIGPTLSLYAVNGVLNDPNLSLISGAQTIATNEDWGGTSALSDAFTSVGAFPLPPASRDAALSVALGNGLYSVQLAGRGGTTGVALVEAYDLNAATPGTGPRLVNVSTRAQVGVGDGVLIAGFAVGGSTSKTFLIRGVGPQLGAYGVTGFLSNPELRVYSGGMLVATNDDWNGDTSVDLLGSEVQAFPLSASGKDAAVLVTLPPGIHTAQVSGVANTTGVGLIEVYELP